MGCNSGHHDGDNGGNNGADRVACHPHAIRSKAIGSKTIAVNRRH